MSSTSKNETEILLGNRHLLAIFFVLAVLLGIAFTGGYMVGRNGPDKKPGMATASTPDPAASSTSLETHSLPPANETADPSQNTPSQNTQAQTLAPASTPAAQTRTAQSPPAETVPPPVTDDKPLGSPKEESAEEAPRTPQKSEPKPAAHAKANAAFSGPQSGQMFLQVAAVGHTEADALAAVLSKKGFAAHAVAKPGSSLYRVLIGPMRDTGELSSARDSLRNAGFTKIFVQRY
jgi:cell division protein FtsN